MHKQAQITARRVIPFLFLFSLPFIPILHAGSEVEIFNVAKGKLEKVSKIEKPDHVWKVELDPEQYRITTENGTERAFTGKYNKHKAEGSYKCVRCGTDLFASSSKYDSKTGWPSFWEPVSGANINFRPDNTLFVQRTEIVCARCGAHLGHLFEDGPPPTLKRYCINSAALAFKETGK